VIDEQWSIEEPADRFQERRLGVAFPMPHPHWRVGWVRSRHVVSCRAFAAAGPFARSAIIRGRYTAGEIATARVLSAAARARPERSKRIGRKRPPTRCRVICTWSASTKHGAYREVENDLFLDWLDQASETLHIKAISSDVRESATVAHRSLEAEQATADASGRSHRELERCFRLLTEIRKSHNPDA
jgi:hypothetical protein